MCKIISNNFENGLLEQIIIDKYTVRILNNIDIDENIVSFVHILSYVSKLQLFCSLCHLYISN